MAAAGAAKRVTAEMEKEGRPVRYLRSTFIPGEDKCYCLFEGDSPAVIREANERADLPMDRIDLAEHVTADQV